jgi:hypothetical protein
MGLLSGHISAKAGQMATFFSIFTTFFKNKIFQKPKNHKFFTKMCPKTQIWPQICPQNLLYKTPNGQIKNNHKNLGS